MYWLYDVCFVAFLLIAFLFGLKKGILRNIFGLMTIIISIAISIFLVDYVSQFLFDTFLKNNLLDGLSKMAQSGSSDSQISFLFLPIDPLSSLFSNYMGSIDGLSQNLNSAILSGSQAIVDYIRPIMVKFLSLIIILPLLLIISIPIKLIFRLFTPGKHHGKMMGLDSFFGGLLGILKCIVIISIVCAVFYMLSPYMSDRPDFMSDDAIKSSFIFKYIYFNNPILKIMTNNKF